MKNGVLLAGGNGTRLFPLTRVVNKHLLGINGKFIIDYPINTLKQMGVENLTVILGGDHFSQVVDHLKDGQSIGMNINYVYQGEAKGIAQAINLCKRFVTGKDDTFVVILGDNLFSDPIIWDAKYLNKAQIVLHSHKELNRFGVASLDPLTENIIKIEEKPEELDLNFNQYAITGCYLFDQRFFKYFENIKLSNRAEYEITDIILAYHKDNALHHTWIDGLWSDAGTHDSIAFLNNYYYTK